MGVTIRSRGESQTQIKLNLIKPSPRPVRTSWDEDKMNELAQSIKEQGVIVPVKVRPIGNEYQLVYGHRRVEAAKRAGLSEIPAIVEGVDDTDALVQALIENVQREDMEPMDKATALAAIKKETGWTTREMSTKGVLGASHISRFLALLDEPIEVQAMIKDKTGQRKTDRPAVGEWHVAQVRRSGLAKEDHVDVIHKTARENLTADQTRRVAEAVRDAPDEETKKALLETPVERDTDAWEAAAHIARDDKKRERKQVHEMAPEVKELLEDIKRTQRIFQRGKDSMRLGKMGPEHAPYIATQLRKLANWLNRWADELDEFREKMVNESSNRT